MVEIVVRRPGSPERSYRLADGAYGIGRHESNAIVLDDAEVSRHHARILVDQGVAMVVDQGSGNGTTVRGRTVEQAPLAAGDVIEILPYTLSVKMVPTGPTGVLEGLDGVYAGQRYELYDGTVTAGRAEDQELSLPDPGASRAHAQFVRVGGQWMVRDLGSANGLFVDDARVSERILLPGSVVRIGQTRLRYNPLGADAQAPAAVAPAAAAPVAPAAAPSNNHTIALVVMVMVGALCLLMVLYMLTTTTGG